MYCPVCGAGYRDGFTRCPDCDVLLAALPPVRQPDDELFAVFESTDPIAAAMAKGLLEEAGIPFWTAGDDALARQGVPFPLCRLLAPRSRETEARAALEVLNENP
jgi:hypothetical protein